MEPQLRTTRARTHPDIQPNPKVNSRPDIVNFQVKSKEVHSTEIHREVRFDNRDGWQADPTTEPSAGWQADTVVKPCAGWQAVSIAKPSQGITLQALGFLWRSGAAKI